MGGDSPKPTTSPTCSLDFPFFFLNPNNKHTQPQETTTPPRDPKVAREGGREGQGGEGGESSPLQSLCFSFQQALGRGLPRPTGDSQPRPAGTEWARAGGQGSRGGSRNGIQNHGSRRHAVSTVGTERGRGVDTTPPGPGHKEGMVPVLGGEVGQLQLQGLGGGAARQDAGVDWCPVDALSSAPSTQPDLIGLFVIY